MDTQSPDSVPPDAISPDAVPTALADLIAAGLVSHEMIGDPARLGPEPEALRVLCGLVSGPIWRIEPFHYAFRSDGEAPEDRAARLETALQAELGADTVWVNATEAPVEAAALDQPLLLLRAHAAAVDGALEAAGPDLQAVINAGFAAETARLTAGAEAGGALDARLAAIEARQAEILAALAARDIGAAAAEATLARLAETLAGLLPRLEAQAGMLQGHIAREDMVAGRLAELAALAASPAAFQETLGLTLAEFLARLERRAEEMLPTRVPQFS